eukprot:8049172-Ditylum_brightwellii.AAC.1
MPTIETVKTHYVKAVTTSCSIDTIKTLDNQPSQGNEGDKMSEEGFDRDGDGHYDDDHDSDGNGHGGDGHGSDCSHFMPCSLRY